MALWTWYINAAQTTLHFWLDQGAPELIHPLILAVAVTWPGLLLMLLVILIDRIALRRERAAIRQATEQGLAKLHATTLNPHA